MFIVGEYAPFAKGSCLDCPLGHKCPTVGTTTPQVCPDGTYTSALRQSSCAVCEGGMSCITKTNSTQCEKGYYSPRGEMNCLPCGPGNYR